MEAVICETRMCRASSQTLSDVEVVRRVPEGEIALFQILMRRCNQRLYRVARAIHRADAEAEDVMQQKGAQSRAAGVPHRGVGDRAIQARARTSGRSSAACGR
jgi:hypothetical protein